MGSLSSPHHLKPAVQPDVMHVQRCRSCALAYDFDVAPGVIVTVICGRPAKTLHYKAVSYLWQINNSRMVALRCQKCHVEKVVPMRDGTKLKKILDFVSLGKESCQIWLDALSIDQDDIEDKKTQLRVMGDIYRNAEITSVLLPVGDEDAYAKLRDLTVVAQRIVDDNAMAMIQEEDIKRISIADETLFSSFIAHVDDWATNLPRWLYFTRAWTFQEWTMASEIEITCEIESHRETIRGFKNMISMAATAVANHKNSTARVAGLRATTFQSILEAKEENGLFVNTVRLMFPFADMPVADNELEGDDLRAHTLLPVFSATNSGTYVSLVSAREQPLSMRALLSLALNSFTMSQRTAFHDADLVECWASMCDIEYDYVPTDSTELTLHKVICALRKTGLKIYNWHVNTTRNITDMTFMQYTAAMRHMNSKSNGFMLGSPTFTGRSDTKTHLKLCLEQSGHRHDFQTDLVVELREVQGTQIASGTGLEFKVEAVRQFRRIVTGKAGTGGITDVVEAINRLLGEYSHQQLGKYKLIVAEIEGTTRLKKGTWTETFDAWAIVPSCTVLNDIFIARESLNGALVLAQRGSEEGRASRILAYLNMTNQKDGTYLIRSDVEGVADVVFRRLQEPLFDSLTLEGLQAAGLQLDDIGQRFFDVVDDRSFNVELKICE